MNALIVHHRWMLVYYHRKVMFSYQFTGEWAILGRVDAIYYGNHGAVYNGATTCSLLDGFCKYAIHTCLRGPFAPNLS